MFKLKPALFILLLSTSAALAHSWYPWECCSGNDCDVILEERWTDEGIVIRTKHGTALFPKDFPLKPSEDQHDHACFNPVTLKPLCLFRSARV